jgi:hypothetical protein
LYSSPIPPSVNEEAMAVPVNQTRENLAVWRYMEVIGVVKKVIGWEKIAHRFPRLRPCHKKCCNKNTSAGWLTRDKCTRLYFREAALHLKFVSKELTLLPEGLSLLLARRTLDRLHGQRRLPFGDHDSQIAVTLGTGALEVLGHSVPSRSQAFVHHDPRNLQPEPFRQLFHAHGEPLKPKAPDLHD